LGGLFALMFVMWNSIQKSFAGIESRLDKKIDDSCAKLDKKIDDSCAKLDKKIDDSYAKLDKKIDDICAQLDKKIDDSSAKDDKKFGDLAAKVERSEAKLNARLDTIEKDVIQINTKMAVMESRLSDIGTNVMYLMWHSQAIPPKEEVKEN
jgi:chromosome segregation ATPase